MTNAEARSRTLFFELYESLPRQGPGNRASAAQALALCADLPVSPAILDLGCGGGAQTLHLADLTAGSIVALDAHAPLAERLRATVAERGLSPRVRVVVGDMANPGLPPGSFDLIWSEGALYNIGIAAAMGVCQSLLRLGGYVAFTDAVWRSDDAPVDVRASFADYPGMAGAETVAATVTAAGFHVVDHFPLPDEAWWDDFYTPMERHIAAMRAKYSGDPEAQAILDQLAAEPEMHRRHAWCYGYHFFIARKSVA